MSDDNIKESFMEDENKVNIELTSVNFGCLKNEPKEEPLDFEEDSHRITLEYENILGDPSHQRKIENNCDNRIGFLDNDVIMGNTMIKLENIKEEDEGANNLYCNKCEGIYKGYCLKCSNLLCILNNNLVFVNSESELSTIPTDILEIRETSKGKGIYLLRTLPINIIFGPFEGISGIESTLGHSWKITDNKLRNIESGNWMKNIVCAPCASLKNLDIFQIDGNLYFQTNREITEGEELSIYYDEEELQQLDNSEECLYRPQKQEMLPKIFACIVCCLGFGSNKCLIEHKRKCYRMEHSRTITEMVLIECHYCKMWMEKWEHEEYHVAYCSQKHHRMWRDYSEAVDRNDADIEEMGDDCGTKDDKRLYQRDICSRSYDLRDSLQFDTKGYQCFSGQNHETSLNEYAFVETSNNEQIQSTVKTINKSNVQKHKSIKQFTCDICMMKFTQKNSLKMHIKNKHTGGVKDYKCSECSYQTNCKSHLQRHLNKHRGIKFQCDICMVKYTEIGNLAKHIKYKHADNGSTKDYKCSECIYETNYKANLEMHLNKHRGISFTCGICMLTFTREDSLKKHIKNKHTDDGIAKNYKCLTCSYQTNDRANLEKHLNVHSDIKPFKCDICMRKFTLKSNLTNHVKYTHKDDGGMKHYKCSECSYQTNTKRNLQNHLNKHRGIKPYRCDICMMTFSQTGHLATHIKNKHTDDGNDKDYKCLTCSYQTNYKANLKKHLNVHTDIKPFQCDICMKKFRQKSQLTAHIRNKHAGDGSAKNYKCSECSYETNYTTNLQRHQNKHRGVTFTCEVCMKEFSQKDTLTKHIQKKHANVGSEKD